MPLPSLSTHPSDWKNNPGSGYPFGTVPSGSPEPGLFQQSMGWVDKDGNGIRYQTIYANQFNGLGDQPGLRGGRGRGAGAGGAGQGTGRQGGGGYPQ